MLREERPPQVAAIEACIAKERGVVQAATGVGKTDIARALISHFGLPTLFIVPDAGLLQQSIVRFSDLGQVGQWGCGRAEVGGDVTVANMQSLASGDLRQEIEPELGAMLDHHAVLIVDEVHHLPAPGLYRTCLACKNAYFRFGLSATAMTADQVANMKVMAAIGGIAKVITLVEAIQHGMVAIPYVVRLPLEKQHVLPSIGYTNQYRIHIVDNEPRNLLIVEAVRLLARQGRKTLITIKDVKNLHGAKLCNLLAQHGLECPVVTGSTRVAQRVTYQKALAAGTIPAIIGTVYDEGKDIPEVDAVILAAGEFSPLKLLQRMGRGLRKKQHNFLVVVDLADNTHRLFRRHARLRIDTLERERVLTLEGWDWLANPSKSEAVALAHYGSLAR